MGRSVVYVMCRHNDTTDDARNIELAPWSIKTDVVRVEPVPLAYINGVYLPSIASGEEKNNIGNKFSGFLILLVICSSFVVHPQPRNIVALKKCTTSTTHTQTTTFFIYPAPSTTSAVIVSQRNSNAVTAGMSWYAHQCNSVR